MLGGSMSSLWNVGLVSVILFAAACASPRPNRVDPLEYPSVTDDTGIVPIPNTCATRTHPFSLTTTGHVESTIEGYAVYEYKAVPDRMTAIYLTACAPEETAKYITLAFFGIDRIEPNEYEINRFAFEDGGFLFAYTDATPEGTVTCSQLPRGTVTITESDFSQVSGSFEAWALCDDASLQDRRPVETAFTGTFTANNVGNE